MQTNANNAMALAIKAHVPRSSGESVRVSTTPRPNATKRQTIASTTATLTDWNRVSARRRLVVMR